MLYVYDINEYLRASFTLEGIGVLLMWVGIATPVGWFLGIVVTLADLVRPRSGDGNSGDTAEGSE